MKKIPFVIITLIAFCSTLGAQNAAGSDVTRQLLSFSPLGEIFVRNLGLIDRNDNGVIDRDAGEGFEEFIEKYGYADIGFLINGVVQGEDNGRLEENEIVNHYYVHIRFRPDFAAETEAIDNEIKALINAHGFPLIWLDDEDATVMSAVNRILGEGWNERDVTEDEAVRMFNRAMQGMRIIGRRGDPGRTGYHSLPEMVNRRAAYCFEAAQAGFWFFSELGINSNIVSEFLSESLLHAVVRLNDSGRIIDFFNSSARYRISADRWNIENPVQLLGEFFLTEGLRLRNANQENYTALLEQAAVFNKYDIETIATLIHSYNRQERFPEMIALGEFLLEYINIDDIMNTNRLGQRFDKNNLLAILLYLIKSYSIENNREGFDNIEAILGQYFIGNSDANAYLNYYRLSR